VPISSRRSAKRSAPPEIAHSGALRLKLDLAADEYDKAARALWRHPRLAELIPDYFFRIHSIIRASVPVMEAALARARSLAASDPLAASLAAYLSQHVDEERHHDEWLLDDLTELGVSREAVWSRMPSPTVAQLVGAQYYWIHHHHPAAVLGYIAVLEGNPPVESDIAEVMKRTRLPERAFRTFIKHARLDPHHKDDLDAALDAMPVTEEHETLIATSALETQHLLAVSLREVLSGSS
jgi:pyrroloquinoline quinone (PQQ) biosynthesis protein C